MGNSFRAGGVDGFEIVIDFTTAGLENPLTYFLIVVFCSLYPKSVISVKRLFFLYLIASLAGVNRLDTVLIFLPALLF